MIVKGAYRVFVTCALIAASANCTAAVAWEHAKAADAAMVAYLTKHKVPNVSVAVAKNGRILYAKGWTWSESASPVRGGDKWVFRLASVSKPITSIMAMELAQQGKLDLARAAREYVPSLPASHTYTLPDLMSHLSGMRHYRLGADPTTDVTTGFSTAESALSLFINDPLIAQPREKYSYSTHAYTVLAATIEKLTSTPFPDYAASRFRAWGLRTLGPELTDKNSPNRVPIYDAQNRRVDRDNLSWKYAGGGYESNASDLCKLADSLLKGRIINSEQKKQMWSAQTLKNGGSSDYGYGWQLETEAGKRLVSHSGGQRGANSYWKLYPDDGVVVVVLTNRVETQPGKLAEYFSKLAITKGTAPTPSF